MTMIHETCSWISTNRSIVEAELKKYPQKMSVDSAFKILSSYGKGVSIDLLIGVMDWDTLMIRKLALLGSRPYLLETVAYDFLYQKEFIEATLCVFILKVACPAFDIENVKSELRQLVHETNEGYELQVFLD